MAKTKSLKPGHAVFVVERDETGKPVDVSGYMFLAKVSNAAIVTPYINDLESLDETVAFHIDETVVSYETHLAVFPYSDCYLTQQEAEAVLEENAP